MGKVREGDFSMASLYEISSLYLEVVSERVSLSLSLPRCSFLILPALSH